MVFGKSTSTTYNIEINEHVEYSLIISSNKNNPPIQIWDWKHADGTWGIKLGISVQFTLTYAWQ